MTAPQKNSLESEVGPNGNPFCQHGLVQALLEEMSDRSFVETRVSNAAQQLTFIQKFAGLSVKQPAAEPAAGTPKDKNRGIPDAPGNTNGSGGTGGAGDVGGRGKSNGTSPRGGVGGDRAKPVTLRKKLAKNGLRISNQPLNKFYSELRALNVEKNPHLASAVIRVFVEKSSTLFLEELRIPPLNQSAGASWQDYGVKLKDKVGSALTAIDPSGSNRQLNAARDIANGSRDKLHTADRLNEAIHSHHALPSHTEIITIWDRLHPYLAALFEAIEQERSNP